jgi:hypothetical protein
VKHRIAFINLPLLAVFLALTSTALARSTWYVNGVSGSDGNACTSPTTACKTIGHAISLASSGDSIMVAAATYKENLTIGLSLTLIGAGASTTIIDGGYITTVLTISNADVVLSRVTIQHGSARNGGGIVNYGILTIKASTISGNRSAAVYGGTGGGIFNRGTLTIQTTTLSGNVEEARVGNFGGGGGIRNAGTLTINNSTISGNSAGGTGGGIDNFGTLTIHNSTLSGNKASSGGGGGIANSSVATATLQNSIVANSPAGGNCGGTLTSKGYNLSSDSTCNFNKSGDLNNTDPMLGPLQNNGGPTQTMALPAGSPAIDAGNPSGCTDSHGHLLKTDQRGRPRPDKEDTGGCDMGAYERQSD